MMLLISGLVVAAALLFAYFKQVYSYWKNRGVDTPSFKYIFGNLGDSLIVKRSVGAIYTDIYNKYNGYNYVGYYKFMKPGLLIRNPEIIKDILSKNFSSFHDNDMDISEKHDLIFGKNPFVLKGDRWKVVRNQISPCFSSSKMKQIVPLLQANAKKMVKYLGDEPSARNGKGIEAKELASLFTAENVAISAFGLEAGCFTNPEAEFKKTGSDLMKPSFKTSIVFLMVMFIPSLSKLFRVKFTADHVTEFFRNIITQTIKYRKENNIRRNDFMDFMIDTKDKINDENVFGLNDIIAHAGGFFMDGYETSSVAISYMLYEVATNRDVQEKLRNDIRNVLKKHGGEITYDALQDMEYLDCVFKENLRKNVPFLVMLKTCTVPFTLPPMMEDETGPEVRVEAGTPITLPIYAIHRDEKYYPEPLRFNPERFSAENKNSTKALYLPFGDGPRMCLGNKFAVLQTKMAIAAVVANYEITVNKKTKEPLELDHRHFLVAPVGGLWLDFKKIE